MERTEHTLDLKGKDYEKGRRKVFLRIGGRIKEVSHREAEKASKVLSTFIDDAIRAFGGIINFTIEHGYLFLFHERGETIRANLETGEVDVLIPYYDIWTETAFKETEVHLVNDRVFYISNCAYTVTNIGFLCDDDRLTYKIAFEPFEENCKERYFIPIVLSDNPDEYSLMICRKGRRYSLILFGHLPEVKKIKIENISKFVVEVKTTYDPLISFRTIRRLVTWHTSNTKIHEIKKLPKVLISLSDENIYVPNIVRFLGFDRKHDISLGFMSLAKEQSQGWRKLEEAIEWAGTR